MGVAGFKIPLYFLVNQDIPEFILSWTVPLHMQGVESLAFKVSTPRRRSLADTLMLYVGSMGLGFALYGEAAPVPLGSLKGFATRPL